MSRTVLWMVMMAAGSTLASASRAQDHEKMVKDRVEARKRYSEEFRRHTEALRSQLGGTIPPGAVYSQAIPGQHADFLAFAMDSADDPTLGATLVPVPERLRAQLKLSEGRGLVASVVEPGGSAARAGLQTNDILLSLGDDHLAKAEDLSALLKEAKDADTLELKILRGGKPVTLKVRRVVTVTLGPADEKERSDYVLGVAVSVPDDALRAHLDLPKDRGLLVDQVVKGSAAEKGGVKQNDVLVSIAGKPLEGTETLINQVRESKDKPTELRLVREGKELTLVVTPEKRALRGRVALAREPLRMFMFDPTNPNNTRVAPGMPSMNVPGLRVQPFSPSGANPRVEQLEKELKSLRESIEELKDALKSGKKD